MRNDAAYIFDFIVGLIIHVVLFVTLLTGNNVFFLL